jgi:hypothetical protein
VSDFRRYFETNDVARLVARNIRYNLGGKVGKEIRRNVRRATPRFLVCAQWHHHRV